jgi:hypothetical protein
MQTIKENISDAVPIPAYASHRGTETKFHTFLTLISDEITDQIYALNALGKNLR